jgi:hypothetical protein
VGGTARAAVVCRSRGRARAAARVPRPQRRPPVLALNMVMLR